jgi:endonuclease-3
MRNKTNSAQKIIDMLKKEFPDARSALEFADPFELLIATILSAQCTDERVNMVTEELFKKFRSPEDFVKSDITELEKAIYSTGYYKQKAKNIKLCCEKLINDFGGAVPRDFDSLTTLPGVGRKTASVVMGNGFGVPAIAVDTHVVRLSNLLGFVSTRAPEKIEMKLKEIIKSEDWVIASHLLAAHGRKVCDAKKPECGICILSNECPSFNYKQKA